MRQVDIKRADGNFDKITTYDIHDFPYDKLNNKALICKHKKIPKYIAHTFATFDIETSTIMQNDKPVGFMYHWQMSIGGFTVTGRTWEQWILLMDKLTEIFKCDKERHLVIYVHNLAYEFQFVREFLLKYMGGCKVFAAQRRKPIHVTTGTGIEFRCSYKLTNMSLDKFSTNELGVIHPKAKGDLDYKKIRTAETSLNDTEFGYCVSDVVSLYESIERRLINEGDNLESIPLTSTGYVRRDCRNACRKDRKYRDHFLKQKMTPSIYELLKETGRGGNTHANRYMSGRIWHNVDSYDIVSSYPAQMKMRKFPSTKFTPYGEIDTMAEFNDLINEYACLFRVIFTNIRVKKDIAMPYIPISKCLSRAPETLLDNGRVLKSDFIAMTLTDIDYDIIKNQYEWDEIDISDMHISNYAYLPEPLINQVMEYFKNKTELKFKIENLEKEDTPDKEELANLIYLYGKSKNRLNGIFGMCYTDPVRDSILIEENGEWSEESADIAEMLEKYFKSRNSFLIYAWGVWVTAWARLALEDLINATGQSNTIYCDTDSSKAVDVDQSKIDELNAKVIKLAEERGAYYDCGGKRYYMGIYEHENKKPIKEFKTLGAKKYVYVDEKGLHITIAGVNKSKGAPELGTINNFAPGFIFKDAGGLELHYNDNVGITDITVNGCTMTTASNVGMVDSTYEIGITSEYAELIGYSIYYDVDKCLQERG